MNEAQLGNQNLGDCLNAEQVNLWLAEIPYAQLLDVQAVDQSSGLHFLLHAQASNVGNPLLPALHGGVLAAFMETAAVLNVMAYCGGEPIPKVVDFSIDYLRSAGLQPTWASCQLGRLGKRLVNVTVTAWQGEELEAPLALARCHLIWPESTT